MPTVLCMSNGLICDYVTDIYFYVPVDKTHHESCEICYDPSQFYKYYLVYNMPII